MRTKIFHHLLSGICFVSIVFWKIAGSAQSVPCAAITQNPQVLKVLIDSHSEAEESQSSMQPDAINAAHLDHLRFAPVAIRPGDALYVEYRGKGFTINAKFASGDFTAFDAPPRASNEQWRKGILPLDLFHAGLEQRLVRLTATGGNLPHVSFRNIRIIRSGRPIFEFAKLASYGQPKLKRTVQRVLPCKAYDADPLPEPPATPMRVNYSIPTGTSVPGIAPSVKPTIPAFPMMLQSTTTDPSTGNHFKFTGQELDAESGLYMMGARHYSPSLGRFIQPDPLYIEAHRLADPQQLNLYTYGRNNPVTFSDPTGLDVKLNCDNRQNCNQAVQDFNNRKNGQFQTELGKDGKLHVVKGSVGKNLSKAEAALMGAINDTKNHATINVSGNTGQSEFGTHDSRGVNSVDLGNLSKLDAPGNAGGLNSGDALAHEALDSYFSLSMGEEAADQAAAGLYPGLFGPTNNHNSLNPFGTAVTGSTFLQGISDGRGAERISIQFITPIPAIDIDPRLNSQERRNEAAHDAGSRVTGATFEPKQ
jgi:RHS repeat-associated protein